MSARRLGLRVGRSFQVDCQRESSRFVETTHEGGIMRSFTRWLAVAGIVVTLLLLVGCGGATGGGTGTTKAPQTTTSGEAGTTTTKAPETTTTGREETTTTKTPQTTATSGGTGTTAAPDTGEATSNTWLFIVIGVVLLVVIVAIIASWRSRKAKAAAAAGSTAAATAVPAWRAVAEQAYSQSRWLYENLTPEIAQWRGDLLHRGEGRSGDQLSDTASAQQQTWNQLGTQMTAAATTLYSLELQVDPASQPVVRSLIDALNNTRTAVDDVASARLAVDEATDAYESDSGNQRLQQDLSFTHDRENQSVQNLNGSRAVLQGALANLAALK
jgi:hypothetical protein